MRDSHGLRYGAAGRRVLALVSGMRHEKRLGRRLLVLQAFIDESYTPDAEDGRGRLFIMAGFVAPVETWMDFSDEWAKLLGLGPPHFRRIDELHMTEMAHSPLGLEQSGLFYRVIEKYLDTAIACVIRLDDLKRVFSETEWPEWLDNKEILIDEYFAGFDAVVRALAIHARRIGVTEPVDVTFDEGFPTDRCMRAWKVMKSYVGHPEIRAMLGETPVFRSSKAFMPLQAADLLAYWVRRTIEETPLTAPDFKLKMPWKQQTTKMKSLLVYRTPEMIRNDFRGIILSTSLLRAGVPAAQVSHILGRGFGHR